MATSWLDSARRVVYTANHATRRFSGAWLIVCVESLLVKRNDAKPKSVYHKTPVSGAYRIITSYS